MTTATLFAAATGLVGLAACGSPGDVEGRAPKRSASPSVSLERSGGIAGGTETVRVDRDGEAVVAAMRGKMRFRLPRRQRTLLACNLRRTPWEEVENQEQPPTPDGFTYVVRRRGRTVRIVDTSAVPTPLRAAIARLSMLIDQAPGPLRVPPMPGDDDC